MKKNIIYICGDNSAGIEADKNLLIDTFREKYGTENIEICPLENTEKYQEYYEKIASVSLFQNMRMFVFFGGKEKKGRSKKEKIGKEELGFESFLEKLIDTLAETDFLLFYQLENGEEGVKKWLEKHATIRQKNLSWNAKEWQKKYHISDNSASRILSRYKNAEKMREKGENNPFLGHNIANTMKNISILESIGEVINDEIIEHFSHEYQGSKIFDFVDAILSKNITKALHIRQKMENHIQSPEEMKIFLGQFLGILRKNLYILFLQKHQKTAKEIAKILPGTQPFFIDKTLKSVITLEELQIFFKKISYMIIAYRTGKGMKETILGQFLEIDTALFLLKK